MMVQYSVFSAQLEEVTATHQLRVEYGPEIITVSLFTCVTNGSHRYCNSNYVVQIDNFLSSHHSCFIATYKSLKLL